MKATLEAIKARAIESIDTANDLESLDRLYVAILGRNGELTGILRSMPQLSKEERAEMGKKANIVKQEIEALFTQRRAVIAKEAQEKAFLAESVDVTCPGVKTQVIGHLHPLTKTYREIRDVLIGMGFTTFASPEVELEKYNFTMLNLPPDHPARDMQDTFYINDNVLLRTHTSPGEIRALTTLKPPFRILIPGKVFRVDEVDASHSPVFMQMEALVVDRDINFGDLKGLIDTFVKAVFGDDVKSRLRPSYFPFTEPSVEVDVSCFECGGKGCSLCKGTGWIEVLGGGVVNKKVLENCGVDPEVYSGLAFGIGVERITMLKYGIPNMGMFFANDLDFLKQFKA